MYPRFTMRRANAPQICTLQLCCPDPFCISDFYKSPQLCVIRFLHFVCVLYPNCPLSCCCLSKFLVCVKTSHICQLSLTFILSKTAAVDLCVWLVVTIQTTSLYFLLIVNSLLILSISLYFCI